MFNDPEAHWRCPSLPSLPAKKEKKPPNLKRMNNTNEQQNPALPETKAPAQASAAA
jgi:hypothetical protein